MTDEKVIYDILADGIGWTPIVLIGVWLLGALVAATVFWLRRRDKKPFILLFLSVWLCGWLGIGGMGFGNVVFQHLRCVSWAKSGDFEISEGPVTDFRPLDRWAKGKERFTVTGVTFAYSDADLSFGGYRRESGGGRGPIDNGVRVRVCHRDGRILRLSILHDTPKESGDGDGN